MGSEWVSGNLSQIAEIIMGQSPKGSDCNRLGKGLPLLNGPTEFGSYHPLPAQYTTDPKKYAKVDDLLFCVRGSTTGRMNWADQEYAIGRGIASIRHAKGKKYQPYLKAVIDSQLQTLLKSATGSTFPNVSRDQLLNLSIKIPPFEEQQTIAHILGSLDDKIELNRKMNETLEAMAQALFKSWFIDFDPVIDNALAAGKSIPKELRERAEQRKSLGDTRKSLPKEIQKLFPDEFVKTEETGWIPKGWEVNTIGDMVNVIGGGTPSTKQSDFWEGGIHAFCTPKDLSNLNSIILLKTERRLTDKGVKKICSRQLPIGTVLLSSRAPIGYLAISNVPVSINQGIIALIGQNHFREMFIFCWVKTNMDNIIARANGSTFLEISKKNFRPIPFLVPGKEIVNEYNKNVDPIYNRLIVCSHNIENLTKIRDELLPKLLSGEICISDAHISNTSVEKVVNEL